MQLASRILDIASPFHAAGSGKGPGLLKSVKFEPGSLYILLSDVGDNLQFHWGLYLAITASIGHIFHFVCGPRTGFQWAFQAKKIRENAIPYSVTLLAGVKIADMDECLQGPLASRLATIHNSEYLRSLPPARISCVEWIREALVTLDQERYIKLIGDIGELETEAWMLAAQNKTCKRRTIINSQFCI
ncbi:hypothetical protein PISL3812_00071 [Talaromyces islandicus]|uniref:Uncharacterized protein n=1 Tax=Talaromyces islandicus TaxID=28573 RepID=A0A0U1LJY3_TALIS|nr:hypothetical protein PISL3812_00071 [Talaromyces islandicus]